MINLPSVNFHSICQLNYWHGNARGKQLEWLEEDMDLKCKLNINGSLKWSPFGKARFEENGLRLGNPLKSVNFAQRTSSRFENLLKSLILP